MSRPIFGAGVAGVGCTRAERDGVEKAGRAVERERRLFARVKAAAGERAKAVVRESMAMYYCDGRVWGGGRRAMQLI